MRRWRLLRLACVFWLLTSTSGLPAQAGMSAKDLRLLKALTDPSFKVRLQAAILIGKRKIQGAAPALRKAAMDDRHEAVRAAVIIALGKIGDKESRSKFAYLIAHKSRLIARAAEKALIMLDQQKNPPPVYLVAITKPVLPEGVPSSRGYRLLRKFRNRLKESGGIVLSAGEEDVLDGSDLAGHLAKRRLVGMLLQPKVITLSTGVSGGRTILTCKVNLIVMTLVGQRLEFSSSGEANSWVEGSDPPEEIRIDMENQALDGSAEAAISQVLDYLANRSEY